MRKFITSIAVIAMAAAMMTGCGSADKKTTTAASTKAEVQTEAKTEAKTEKETEKGLVLELKVAPSDMGKVIGKQGRIAKAIRSVVKAAASRENKQVSVEIE